MDGLSVSPPVGDPDYAALRGRIAIAPFGQAGGALKLDDVFGLHPALASVHRLALDGQARICPAVATPDRARSHFEAQDVVGERRDRGLWRGLRLAQPHPAGPAPQRKIEALSVGVSAPLILRGPVQAGSWSPGGLEGRDARLPPAAPGRSLRKDPLLGPALASGLETQGHRQGRGGDGGRPGQRTAYMFGQTPAAESALTARPAPDAARQVGTTVATRGLAQILARIDYQLSANNTLSIRYQYYRDSVTNDGVGQYALASQEYNILNTEQTLQVSDTQVFGGKIVNETHFQYIRTGENRGAPEHHSYNFRSLRIYRRRQ